MWGTRPFFLEVSTYVDESRFGNLPSAGSPARTLKPITRADMRFLLDGDALIGLQASTEHIAVGTLSVSPGACSTIHAHGGDEVLFCLAELGQKTRCRSPSAPVTNTAARHDDPKGQPPDEALIVRLVSAA